MLGSVYEKKFTYHLFSFICPTISFPHYKKMNVLPISECYTQAQTNGSSPPWDILENEIPRRGKIVSVPRNDSMCIFGENRTFYNIGDEPQVQERHLR